MINMKKYNTTNVSMKSILFLFAYWFVSSMVTGQNTKDELAPMNVFVTDFKNEPQKGEQILFEGETTGDIYKGVSDQLGKFKVLGFK